jgi:hypothetical protein
MTNGWAKETNFRSENVDRLQRKAETSNIILSDSVIFNDLLPFSDSIQHQTGCQLQIVGKKLNHFSVRRGLFSPCFDCHSHHSQSENSKFSFGILVEDSTFFVFALCSLPVTHPHIGSFQTKPFPMDLSVDHF